VHPRKKSEFSDGATKGGKRRHAAADLEKKVNKKKELLAGLRAGKKKEPGPEPPRRGTAPAGKGRGLN